MSGFPVVSEPTRGESGARGFFSFFERLWRLSPTENTHIAWLHLYIQNKFKSREFGLCVRETDSCNKQKVAHNVIHMHAASPRLNWRWCICNLIQHPFMNQLIHCQVAVVVGPALLTLGVVERGATWRNGAERGDLSSLVRRSERFDPA